MSSEFCESCGAEYARAPTPFCRHCGIPRPGASAPAEPTAALPAPRAARGRWFAVLAFLSAGGWLLAVAADSLEAVLQPELAAFTAGDVWVRLEIYGAVTLDAMLGCLLIVIAWMLYRGHRTARGLGCIVGLGVPIALFSSHVQAPAARAAMVACVLGALVMLASPTVCARDGRDEAHTRGVLVSRAALLPFGLFGTLAALVYAAGGVHDRVDLLVAALLASSIVLTCVRSGLLLEGSRRVRAEISTAAVALVVCATFVGAKGLLVFPLSLLAGAVVLLWCPDEVRARFGDTPWPRRAVAASSPLAR